MFTKIEVLRGSVLINGAEHTVSIIDGTLSITGVGFNEALSLLDTVSSNRLSMVKVPLREAAPEASVVTAGEGRRIAVTEEPEVKEAVETASKPSPKTVRQETAAPQSKKKAAPTPPPPPVKAVDATPAAAVESDDGDGDGDWVTPDEVKSEAAAKLAELKEFIKGNPVPESLDMFVEYDRAAGNHDVFDPAKKAIPAIGQRFKLFVAELGEAAGPSFRAMQRDNFMERVTKRLNRTWDGAE